MPVFSQSDDKVLVRRHPVRIARPSHPFRWGWGHMLDLHGSMLDYNFSHVSDVDALRSDWERIGGDIRIAIYHWAADPPRAEARDDA